MQLVKVHLEMLAWQVKKKGGQRGAMMGRK